jgi:4-carboxymuconolactone decarboxylase
MIPSDEGVLVKAGASRAETWTHWVVSVMIAMRQPHEFAIHMGAGLNNGLTLKEIEEVLIQALPYVGYPAIATALAAAAEVIKEHGLDSNENYTGHRGLL